MLEGGPVAKAKNNLAAIALAQRIDGEQRPATREEQAILAKFIGWGPLTPFFDPKTSAARRIEEELRKALGWEDFAAAKKASRNSHYTDPRVIQATYTLLDRLGVKGGTFLEPSVGSGLFIGMQPASMAAGTRWIASDLDPTTASIARLLYPQAAVQAIGFQELAIADNSIDVAISNVPFGNYPVYDRRLPKFVTQQIHDYFFARAIQKVRPGGLVVFITSAGTMDKGNPAIRAYLQQQGASLVTAMRLPAGAFQDIARTEVTTDLIVLQKHAATEGPAWREAVSIEQGGETYRINEYYREHPEQMLGVLAKSGTMYRADSQELAPREGEDLVDAMTAAIANAPSNIYTPAAPRAASAKPEPVKVSGVEATVRVGSYQVGPTGDILVRKKDGLEVADVPEKRKPRVKQYIVLRDLYKVAMQLQLDDAPADEITTAVAALNREYDAFVRQFGPINLEKHTESDALDETGQPVVKVTYPNRTSFDAEWPLVAGLEDYDHDAYENKQPNAVRKSAALLGRVIFKRTGATSASSPSDALGLTLNELGRVDESRIAELLSVDVGAVEELLGELVYRNPDSGQLEPKGLYLSGDVKDKLAIAEAAAKQDRRYERNVADLVKVQPEDVPSAYIPSRIGQTWIPAFVYQEFVRSTFGVRASLQYIPVLGKWDVGIQKTSSVAATQTFGTEDILGTDIFEALLKGESIEVTDPPVEKGGRRIKNADKTALALEKAEALKEHFNAWLWKDEQRAELLGREYNDRFNRVVEPEWDGSHLTTPGVAESLGGGRKFEWLSHQKNGIYRYIARGNLALVYDVGAGKTFTMAGIAMEARRLGLARRPVVTYPNNLLAQWPKEAQALYPGANILAVNEADLKGAEARQSFAARMQAGDYDMILMPESVFVKIGMSKESYEAFIEEQIDEYLRVMREMEEADKSSKGSKPYKQLQNQIEKLEVQLQERINAESKDELLTWEELGADLLIVDEVHRYKNLYFPTSREGVSGTQNHRSTDFYLKTRYMHRVNPGRGLVLASGTIVANNVAPELYAMQRYLQPDTLGAAGIHHFDAWITQFAEEKQELEQKANGNFEYVPKIDEWTGIQELQQLFFQVFDVQKATSDMDGPNRRGFIKLKRPPRLNGRATIVEVPGSPRMDETMQWIASEYERIKNLRAEDREGEPIIPTLVKVGEVAAIDMRLAFADGKDSETSKLSVVARELAARWRASKDIQGTQVVFLDAQRALDGKTGLKGVAGFNSHVELLRKLHEDYGIPREQMASVTLAKNRMARQRMIDAANHGKVRIILGTTALMGVGTNLQARTTAIHHIDVPYRPDELEQRNGRAIRQGHKLWEAGKIEGVEEVRYATVGSLDSFKWGKVERKDVAIQNVMTRTGARSVADVDVNEGASSEEIAQIKAIASGNPYLLESAQVTKEIKRLEGLRRSEADNARKAQEKLRQIRQWVGATEQHLQQVTADVGQWVDLAKDAFAVTIGKQTYRERKDAHEAMARVFKDNRDAAQGGRVVPIGRIGPFDFALAYSRGTGWQFVLQGASEYRSTYFDEAVTGNGITTRLENIYSTIPEQQSKLADTLRRAREQEAEYAAFQYGGFSKAVELDRLRARKAEIDRLLLGLNKQAPTEETNAADVDEDGTDEDGTEERMAYTDPIAALIGETVRAIRSRMQDRRAATAPYVRSTLDEVEARMRTAERGLPTLPWADKLRAAIEDAKKLRRHFKELDPTRDQEHGIVNELLLNAERSGSWAKAMAADQLNTVVRGLAKADAQAMSRTLALQDILADLDSGLYADGRALPFGYASRAEVEADLADAEAEIAARPAVAAAVERRQAMARALTTRLVEADALPASVLDDPRYFHRQVLSYAEARVRQQMKGNPTNAGTPREVRNRKRGFQKGRVGGGDFNLAYIESEYEWVAQAHQILALHDILQAIKQFDRTPQLKAQIKQLNLRAFYDVHELTPEMLRLEPKRDPLLPFRSQIARSKQQITTLLAKGEIDYAPQYDHMVRSLLEAEEAGQPFSHPQWWSFLSSLVASGRESPADVQAAISAASIFKAIKGRNQLIEDTLGADFLDASDPDTLLELAGEGFKGFQPEKGNIFYQALSVPEKAMMDGTAGTLEGEHLRRVLALGGKKPTWILPEGIVATLEQLTPPKASANALEAVLKTEVRWWKQWTLLSPARAIKYNLNNMVGDVDAAMLAPGVMRYAHAAAQDLWRYTKTRDLSTGPLRELQEAMRLGVIGQSQTAVEIPDIVTLAEFQHLATTSPGAFGALVGGYWQHAKGLTQWRENILRLAAYRYYRDQLAAGKVTYGASNRARVNAVRGINEKAALLARDLLGDYGNISVGGEFARERLLPFYSWMEVNAKRYVNYVRNIPYEEEGPTGAAGRAAAAAASRLGLGSLSLAIRLGAKFAVGAALMAGFLSMVAAWNALMFPDEWDDMHKSGRDGQLILGRGDDGRVISIRVEGAFADFLSWVGLKDVAADIRDLARGRIGYGDLLKDAALAPVRKVIGAIEPMTQSLITFVSGKRLYPDPLNPTPVRDPLGRPWGVFFDQWGVGALYRQILLPIGGVPAAPSAPGNPLVNLFAYQTDAGELAYHNTQRLVREWQESRGKAPGAGEPSEKASALYYFRKASQWGEEAAAEAWLQRYYTLGGTPKSARESITRADPLSGVADRDRRTFLASRSPEELAMIERGRDWYTRVYRSTAQQTVRAVRPGVRAAPIDTSWIAKLRAEQTRNPLKR